MSISLDHSNIMDLQEAITLTEKGGYSHWKSKLYFSSSDGSDPNKNGRIYKIVIKGLSLSNVFLEED